MKKILLLGLLCFSLSLTSQELLPKSIYTLNGLGIETQHLNLKDNLVQQDLNSILYFNKRMKTNRVFAYIFTVYGAISFLTGSYLALEGRGVRGKDGGLTSAIGTIGVIGGVVYGGASIPFWIGAKKNKERRNKLILKFQ
jgi:hypothetical protein